MSYISVEDYDPNDPDHSKMVWMVYTGALKLYSTRGPAIARLLRRWGGSNGKLFKWDAKERCWVLMAHKFSRPNNSPCDLCGGPTVLNYDGRDEDTAEYVFDRKGRKLVDPLNLLFTCGECREGRGLF